MMRFKPQIETVPFAGLPVPLDRQQTIIDTITARLAANPRHGFCFVGSPGTGKTYLMGQIREAQKTAFQRNQRMMLYLPKGDPEIEILAHSAIVESEIITLSGWQRAHVERIRLGSISKEDDGETVQEKLALKKPFDVFDEDLMRITARYNEEVSKSLKLNTTVPLHTLHLFVDEFDSQPTRSEFAQNNLEQFVNACYRYAPRICEGNDGDFLQLVVSMNKSWGEFTDSYGIHVARRVHEMCTIIDFDSGRIDDVQPSANAPDAVDVALEGLLP